MSDYKTIGVIHGRRCSGHPFFHVAIRRDRIRRVINSQAKQVGDTWPMPDFPESFCELVALNNGRAHVRCGDVTVNLKPTPVHNGGAWVGKPAPSASTAGGANSMFPPIGLPGTPATPPDANATPQPTESSE